MWNLSITANPLSYALQWKTSFSHLVLGKNAWLSSLDLNNDLKINTFHLLLHDIFTFQENIIIGAHAKLGFDDDSELHYLKKLLNKMLLSTCVLCAKCKVWFSVLQLHICPCKTWIIMKKCKGADWLPSRNLKFSKLLPPTHTHPQPHCCEDYESFLLEQSLKPELSLQLFNNLHILAPLPPRQSPWKCPLWAFPSQVIQRNLEPISFKASMHRKKGERRDFEAV